MKLVLGFAVLAVVVLLCVLPMLSTLLICCNAAGIQKEKGGMRLLNAAVWAVSIGLNSAVFLAAHRFLRGRWNVLRTVKDIVKFRYSYQEIHIFAEVLIICLVFGVILGLVLRWGLSRRYDLPALSGMCRAYLWLITAVVSIAVIWSLFLDLTGTQHIVINEVAGNNFSAVMDENGTACDYIELYNSGALSCQTEGLYLSDDPSQLKMKKISDEGIPAKGYLIVGLYDESLTVRSEGGETIYLSDEEGNILDEVTTAAMRDKFSYSRSSDGEETWSIRTSTPAASNAAGTELLQDAPEFSHESGFYGEPFDLTLTMEGGIPIYYTLDGSIPTVNSYVYTQPIPVYDRSSEPNVFRSTKNVVEDWQAYAPDETPVDKAFVIRAAAITQDGKMSDVVTATYFIDQEEYTSGTVISIVANPEALFGENGIYVTGKEYDDWYTSGQETEMPLPNFQKRGHASEAEAWFGYFSPNRYFSQNIGIRISGASSRSNPMKAFSLYARNRYSASSVFNSDIIDGVQSHKLALRGGYANTLCQKLSEDRFVAVQRSKLVSVFLNGEFWYSTNLLEKYDGQYFQEHYGVNADNLVLFNHGEMEEGAETDTGLLQELFAFVNSRDLAADENYRAFAELVDIQSFIDYMCINIYIDNMDFTATKNTVLWRSRESTGRPYEDGKWRFCLYDLDAMEWDDADYWGIETQAQKDSFHLVGKYVGETAISQHAFYAAAKANENFQKQFVLTFMDLVNTIFQYENTAAVMDAYGRDISGYHGGRSSDYYDAFFRDRAKYIVAYMAQEFSLEGTLETLTLGVNDSAAGQIQLNTVTPDLSAGTWNGQYYTDYPVKVTAVANDGYTFCGWKGTVNSGEASLEVNLKKGETELYAVFEKTMS